MTTIAAFNAEQIAARASFERQAATDAEAFRSVLAAASGPSAKETRARDAAEDLVSKTFIQPVLKQLREMNDAAPPFGPTAIEKRFGPMLDERIAECIVKAARFPTVDRIASKLAGAAPQDLPSSGPLPLKETDHATPIPYDTREQRPIEYRRDEPSGAFEFGDSAIRLSR